MKYYDIDQNSEEWDEVRRGKFTASTFSDLFMKKDSVGYQKAIIKVAYEQVTGESEESYTNKWMQRGHEKEPIAVENYEILTFNQTEIVGFFEYNEFVGASPDRKIVGENGGLEIKNPSFQVYNEYLATKKLPKAYFWQIHGQLLCTGWDFIDYMPFSSPKLKQILIRVERDEPILSQLREQLEISIEDVKILINRIKQ
jgi:predicted phage-related endonuclease